MPHFSAERFSPSDVGSFRGRSLPASMRRGRGARSSASGRYERLSESFDAEHLSEDDEALSRSPVTTEIPETARSVLNRVTSPDLPFSRSLNPYRGCEHGCVYCYARPSHAYVGLSPGLDFETRIFYKRNAAEVLRSELRKSSYRPAPILLGANTDPYQPIERTRRITRECLKILSDCGHPVNIITKSTLILRDLDLIESMARRNLVSTAISLTTLNGGLSRSMEPRAAAPKRRLSAIRRLADVGAPVRAMIAPVIPAINDSEIERLLEAARDAGATRASYTLLRLPLEVRDLFKEWIEDAYPLRARRALSVLRSMRGGRDYDPRWNARMVGKGEVARLLAKRFASAVRRLGLNRPAAPLATHWFRPPEPDDSQARLL